MNVESVRTISKGLFVLCNLYFILVWMENPFETSFSSNRNSIMLKRISLLFISHLLFSVPNCCNFLHRVKYQQQLAVRLILSTLFKRGWMSGYGKYAWNDCTVKSFSFSHTLPVFYFSSSSHFFSLSNPFYES